jgi:hypothetical protein
MSESCWAALGIAQTSDEALIRQAYAARLKLTRPDEDPDGFRALRTAFETARRFAQSRPPPVENQPLPPELPARPVEQFNMQALREAAARAAELREAQAARLRIDRAIRAGRLLDAAVFWRDAVDSLALPLNDQPRLSEQLARAVSARPPDLAIFDELIGRMDWREEADHFSARPIVVEILARHAALVWFAELQSAAREPLGWRRGALRGRRLAARLLLLPAPGPLRRLLPLPLSRPMFQSWWDGVNRHQAWLDGKLDPKRVTWCRQSTRYVPRLVVALVRLAVLLMLIPLASTVVVALIGVLRVIFVGDAAIGE